MHRRFLGPSNHIWRVKSDNLWMATARIGDSYMRISMRLKPNGWAIYFDLNGETKITGTGHAYEVLNIAASTIRDFLRQVNPSRIFITAKGASRIRLYYRINSRFETWGYTMRTIGSRNACNFIFER